MAARFIVSAWGCKSTIMPVMAANISSSVSSASRIGARAASARRIVYSSHMAASASSGEPSAAASALPAATKAAVVSLSETLHQDLSLVTEQVHAHLLCPFFVATGITDAAKKHSAGGAAENAPSSPLIDRIHQATQSGSLSAADVARFTLEAVRAQRFLHLAARSCVGQCRAALSQTYGRCSTS